MKPSIKLVLAIGLSLAPILGVALARESAPTSPHARLTPAQGGVEAPSLSGRTPGGKELAWSQFGERAVILYFHSSRTRNSVRALEQLFEALEKAHQIKGRCTVLLVVDSDEVGAIAKAELEPSGHEIQLCVDTSRELAHRYGVIAYPTAFVVDGKAHIVDSTRGYGSFFGFTCVSATRYALGLISDSEFQALREGNVHGSSVATRLAAAKHRMANKLVVTGQWDTALKVVTELASVEGADASIFALAGHLELKAGDRVAASEWAERLEQASPGHPRLTPLRACIALAADDVATARALLEGSVGHTPELNYARGRLLEKEGEWQAAAKLYRESLQGMLYVID